MGAITNHSYLDNPTFRAMRYSLIKSYNSIHLVDLHGNLKKNEKCPDGSDDENVFDIMQGVCINVSYKKAINNEKTCKHFDLFGLRDQKNTWLLENVYTEVKFQYLRPTPQLFLFQPVNESIENEYSSYIPFREISPKSLLGFQTHRDEIAISFSKDKLFEQVKNYLKQKPIKTDWDSFCKPCDYRPFDRRFVFLHKSVTDRPRLEITGHLFHKNIAINLCRQTKANNWRHAFVSRYPTPAVFLEIKDGSSIFPFVLYADDNLIGPLFQQAEEKNQTSITYNMANWVIDIFNSIPQLQNPYDKIESSDIISYSYAILFSNDFSKRYLSVLRRDFPYIPIPAAFSLLQSLISIGTDLIALHLLEQDYLKASWNLHKFKRESPFSKPITEFLDSPFRDIAKGFPKYENGTVFINPNNSGFQGVPEDVWKFHIGGYQVCEKWLKDRRGRTLTDEDVEHYQKIVVALKETIRLMGEIDKVIEEHGGFPGAFVTDPKIIEEAKAKARTAPVFSTSATPEQTEDAENPLPQEITPVKIEEIATEKQESFSDKSQTIPIDQVTTEVALSAIRRVFAGAGALDREAAIKEIARELGYDRVGPRIYERLSNELQTSKRRGVIGSDGDLLSALHKSIDDYPRDQLKDLFLSAIGRNWREREDAVKDAAWYLGFQRKGPLIQEQFKSVINGLIREGRLEREGNMIRKAPGN